MLKPTFQPDDILDSPNKTELIEPQTIYHWWENKRLHYNKIVGGTGLVPTGIGILLLLMSSESASFIQAAIIDTLSIAVAYAILANIFYFMGSLIETTCYLFGKENLEDRSFSQFIYNIFLVFSLLAILIIGFTACVYFSGFIRW